MTDSIHLAGLLPLLRDHAQFKRHSEELRTPHEGEWRFPLLRAARPFWLAGIAQQIQRPVLIVAARADRAQAIYDSLQTYRDDHASAAHPLLRLPEPSALFYERAPWAREILTERLNVLTQLTAISHLPSAGCIVASVRALMFRTLPPRAFKLGTRTLKRRQSIVIDSLLEAWLGFGYESATTVLAPGEFSRRGGIVDV
ncbi:MAG TPA: hypothetical protein VII92_16780, partial [Anaerolineae bacterium]